MLLAIGQKGNAQISSTGKTFYMSFMEMETRSGGYPDTLLIFVTSAVNTTLVLDNPRLTGSSINYNITANKVNRISVDVNFYYPIGSEFSATDINSKRGLRIVAKDPVNVYCMNLELNRSDGTFVLPYESIPAAPEYFVVSFPPNAPTGSWPTVTSSYGESEFVVIAMDNSVTVEITPTAPTKGGKAAGTAFTVNLTKGQVYQVQSVKATGTNNTDPAATSWATTGAKNGDLTGTRVRVINGCGKINVFSGNRSAHVTKGNCGSGVNGRDHLYTQVIPTLALGKDYVLMPFSGQTGGYAYKVIAANDNTKVYKNGTLVATIATKGEWIYDHINTATPVCVTTDKPAYVAQYMKNGVCSGLTGTNGDPAVFISPDINQRLIKTIVGTATTSNMNKHWVNILIDQTAKNAVFLNGTKVSAASFTNVTTCNNKYAFAQLAVSNPSSNIIACDSGMIVVAYGVGPYESYSYSAGALFENIEYDFTVARKGNCPSEPVTLTAVVNKSVKAIRWVYGDGTASEWGTKVTHKFSKIGTYYVVMKCVVANACGIDDTITRSKIINVSPGPFLNFPDTFTQCASTLNFKVVPPNSAKFLYKWQDGSTANTYTVTSDKKVWVKITDTSTNCVAQDTTYVRRADPIIAKISYDTLNKCDKQNYFSLSDATVYKNDSRKSSEWRLADNYKSKVITFTTARMTYHFDTLSKNNLRYIVESKKGCRDTLDTTLVVYTYPIAKVSLPPPYFCQKKSMTFLDSSASDQGIAISYWNFGDGSFDTTKTKLGVHTYKNINTYNLRLITESINQCRDTIDSTFVIYPVAKTVIGTKIVNLCLKQNEFEFTDNSTVSAGTFTNRWIVNGKTIDNVATLTKVNYADTGFKKIMLITITDKGCPDTLIGNIYVAPEPKAGIAVTDSSFCFKTHFFDLNDVSVAPSGSSLTARSNFYFSDGSNAYAKLVPTKKFGSPGTYWVRLVATTTLGCKDSIQRNLKVLANPDAKISPENALQCLIGNKFHFVSKNMWTVTGDPLTHTWDLGDGTTSSKDSIDHSYSAIKSYWITHKVVSLSGCSDTSSTSAKIVSSPTPAFITNKDTACFYSQLFNFNDKTVFGSTYSVFWDFGDGTTAITSQYTGKTYTTTGKKSVKLVVTTADGCKDSISKYIDIYPAPAADFTVNTPVQCLQNNRFIFNNTTNENGATTCNYNWTISKPLKNIPTKAIVDQIFVDTGFKSILLVAKTDKNCVSSKVQNIYVAETPIVTIAGKNGCVGDPINFTSSVYLNVGTPSYDWTFGDAGNSTLSNPSHTYFSANTFTVKLKVTSNLGCVGNATDLPIQAFVRPKAKFTSEYLLSRGLETDWKFTSQSTGADKYEWSFEDGQKDYTGGPVFMTFNKTGDFKVKLYVTTNSGCFDSTSAYIFLKPELLYHLPNVFSPNDDGLNDVWPGSNTTSFGLNKYRMVIFDRWGNIMFKTTDPAGWWDGRDMDGNMVLEGVYAYQIDFRYIDNRIYVHKGTVTVLK